MTMYVFDKEGKARMVPKPAPEPEIFIGNERLVSSDSPISGHKFIVCRVHGTTMGCWVHWRGALYRCCPFCIRQRCKITTARRVQRPALSMADVPDGYHT